MEKIKCVKCKELYRIPITLDIIKEVYEMGKLVGKRHQILSWIFLNMDLSEELKYTWYIQYSKEFQEKIIPLSTNIREKLNILEVNNIITPELENGEIVVLDLTKDEYRRLCKKYNYLVDVIYKE